MYSNQFSSYIARRWHTRRSSVEDIQCGFRIGRGGRTRRRWLGEHVNGKRDDVEIVIGGTGQPQHRQLSGVLVGDEHTVGYDQMIMYTTYARTPTEGADVLGAISQSHTLTSDQRTKYGGTGHMTAETITTDAFCTKVDN